MKLLLDTHAFIWWDSAPANLSPRVADLCRDRANQVVLSVASVWEMQVKLQLGKLRLATPLAELIETQRRENAIEVLPVTLPHVLALESLPSHHRDPFDRLLMAQAKVEGAVIASHDSAFAKYPVQLVW